MKKLLYFGCMSRTGHFLYDQDNGHSVSGREHLLMPETNYGILKCIDANFTPKKLKSGIYKESIIPPIRIVGWWDYSVDDRSGSNSNLIGVGYHSAEQMIDDAYKIFPTVMNRQPRPQKE
jgi:hypothetical protein